MDRQRMDGAADLAFLLDLPEGSPRPPSLRIILWDEALNAAAAADCAQATPLAQEEVRLDGGGSGAVEVKLLGSAKDVKVRFRFEMKTEGFEWGEDVRFEEVLSDEEELELLGDEAAADAEAAVDDFIRQLKPLDEI